MIARILLGCAITALGYAMVAKTPWFYSILGSINFVERHIGYGSSRFFYKLLGIAVIIIGALTMTNLFDLLIGGFLRSLFLR